jgi:KipI family sensor histidine kinase inhibitor
VVEAVGDARIEPYGEAAWLVSLEGTAGIDTARRAQALARSLAHDPARPPIAGIASVLVPFDPSTDDPDALWRLIATAVAATPGTPGRDPQARDHEIPVRYGGPAGPDLDAVAAAIGRSPAEVVERHTAVSYEVLALGFAPGYAYLGELDPAIRVPRLATPRPRVPAGSVGIAEAFTGIYPAALPGGWQLIGRTDRRLFDPDAAEPATFRPGDRVRFVAR